MRNAEGLAGHDMLISPLSSPTGWSRTGQTAPPRTDPGFRQSRELSRPTILAVDDEPETLDFLRTFLEGEGFNFVQAYSGPEAIELARQRRPNLMIVDVMMPGMNGLELCAELREARDTSNVPIILYSAYDMKKHSNTGLYDRAFVKPADPDELLWAIQALTSEPS